MFILFHCEDEERRDLGILRKEREGIKIRTRNLENVYNV